MALRRRRDGGALVAALPADEAGARFPRARDDAEFRRKEARANAAAFRGSTRATRLTMRTKTKRNPSDDLMDSDVDHSVLRRAPDHRRDSTQSATLRLRERDDGEPRRPNA